MIERRATALQDMHREPAGGRSKRDTQYGRRGFARRLPRPEQHRKDAACLGGELEPPQLGISDGARPGEHRTAGARGERLFGGPQRFLRGAGLDDDQTGQVDAGSGERRRIGPMGRGDPRQPLARRRQAGEGGAEQAQLSDAFVRGQDLGEACRRPASSGKLGIQRGETRSQAGRGHARKPAAAPQRRLRQQRRGKRRRVRNDAEHRTAFASAGGG